VGWVPNEQLAAGLGSPRKEVRRGARYINHDFFVAFGYRNYPYKLAQVDVREVDIDEVSNAIAII
jgi:hypothetical protein